MFMLWIPLPMMTFQIRLSLAPHFFSFGGGHSGKMYAFFLFLLIFSRKKKNFGSKTVHLTLSCHVQEGIVRVKLAKILAGIDDVHYERSVATGENIKAVSAGI